MTATVPVGPEVTAGAGFGDVAGRWAASARSELLVMADDAETALPVLVGSPTEQTFVVLGPTLGAGTAAATLRDLAAAGARLAAAEQVAVPLVVVDRSLALVPVDHADLGRGAVVVSDARVVRCFRSLFVTTWLRATRLPPGADPAVDERDRRILRLMNAGMTDGAAARVLGVSVRTYRRGVADIMARLDVGNRFQAGAAAARRGWLDGGVPPGATTSSSREWQTQHSQ